jgi:hypothetical protein
MGTYSLWYGELKMSRNLTMSEWNYLFTYLNMRHDAARDVENWLKYNENHLHEIAGIEPGQDGCMIADSYDGLNQAPEHAILGMRNGRRRPDRHKPGIWCDWELTTDDEKNHILKAPGNGQHYNMQEWIEFLIANVFTPWGVSLEGEIEYRSEFPLDDSGTLFVKGTMVEMVYNIMTYATDIGPSWDRKNKN